MKIAKYLFRTICYAINGYFKINIFNIIIFSEVNASLEFYFYFMGIPQLRTMNQALGLDVQKAICNLLENNTKLDTNYYGNPTIMHYESGTESRCSKGNL